MLLRIAEAEEQLNALLTVKRIQDSPDPALLAKAREWSALVWDEAVGLGPMPLSEMEVTDGLRLATRPVYICGVHRSGTTLVRNLLDGHPRLCVLPSEGTFYTNQERHLSKLPQTEWAKHLGTEWLRRLANPVNQAPYWLLGRSIAEASPYVSFARYVLSWWQAVEHRPGTQWPHLAIVLAYASCTNNLKAKYWIDKTPTNEQYLDRIRQEAPDARIIHVIREPLATIASRKVMEPGAAFKGALRALKISYIIAERERSEDDPAYLLVHYEQLCNQPKAVIEEMALLLGIANLPVLGQATVAGMPAEPNSSFGADKDGGNIVKSKKEERNDVLNAEEKKLIAAYLSAEAGTLGYALPVIDLLERIWLRLKYRLVR
ncbi:sulfotransferase family protein [Mucilaginibacter pedocola]|uniref:Sulfotransferase n=1 Tax=Mucilaginibacter pedocola TaxID=1792845 RepID=A0A1S9PFG7_9SPHI|nr:sulfotransferase [Mucilaginibacter pedocola]OOQ59348.1 hypothetical protein BC343_28035 [Mucilaginibacter pedocola]